MGSWDAWLSQRRVTFHLPDGSQESCSDSGLGEHEPVGSGVLLSHPLPLVQAHDDFYEQASPDKRTEADGNSDPNSVLQDSGVRVLVGRRVLMQRGQIMFSSMKTKALLPSIINGFEMMENSLTMLLSLAWLTSIMQADKGLIIHTASVT
ncbi:hypothetical protein DNTS_011423 [Danionella cerebrum]|uniref:Uncharacterized protein n=1 Tax=Danionella cerebrum TaxID=2873325 RepID=A0A553NRF6_9TELE|nr:hypothetical protein DNTS_011423 [Danionella translucida]